MKRALIVLALMGLALWGAGCAGNGRIALLTNEATNKLEPRVGTQIGENWQAGALIQWYSEDVEGSDFGYGVYARMDVDPNATIAVAEWFPVLGGLLNLPEQINVSTYGIGKLLYADHDDGDPLGAALGAGFETGPGILELTYKVVESGDASNPEETSGLEVWFGAGIPF